MGSTNQGCTQRWIWVLAASAALSASGLVAPRMAFADESARPHGTFITVPPRAAPSTIDPSETRILKTPNAPPHRTLYVNGQGATITPGNNVDDSSAQVSSIITSTATIPPYAGTTADWAAFLSCIKNQFSRWNVTVTDQSPGAAPHIEAVVGGSPGLAGLPNGVGGVSPMTNDCSLIETSIVFIFSDVLGDPQTTCEVAAQEIGHSIGMDHEYLCADPMTYLTGCGNKTFQDQTVSCGESAPRACSCSATQNSVQFMNARLGTSSSTPPDPTSPTIALGSPADGATLLANSNITLSADITDPDDAISSAFLIWENNGQSVNVDCANPPTGTTCTTNGSTYTWGVHPGSGQRAWSIQATDSHGNTTTSPKRTLTLSSTPPPVDAGSPPPVDAGAPVPDSGATIPPPPNHDAGTSGGGGGLGSGSTPGGGDPAAPSGDTSQSGGCSTSPGAVPATSAFALFGLAFAALARRKRTRRGVTRGPASS